MTRAEAARLVRKYGGIFATSVNRSTSLLIVGQDGWPFDEDGRLTIKLRKARALQRAGHGITVLTEEELLARLEPETQADGVRRLTRTLISHWQCVRADIFRVIVDPTK